MDTSHIGIANVPSKGPATTVDCSGISKNVHVKSTHLNVEPKIEQCDLKIEIAVESINLRKSFICSTLYRYLYDRDAYNAILTQLIQTCGVMNVRSTFVFRGWSFVIPRSSVASLKPENSWTHSCLHYSRLYQMVPHDVLSYRYII